MKPQEEAQASMIADGLREFIEVNQYDYVRVSDICFRLRFCGKNGNYTMFAQATEDPGQILVFTYCPVKVPEDRRSLVADYLNRVNYGLVVGCIEMVPADGEVRSRSTAPVGSGEPGPSVFGPLFDSSFYLIEIGSPACCAWRSALRTQPRPTRQRWMRSDVITRHWRVPRLGKPRPNQNVN